MLLILGPLLLLLVLVLALSLWPLGTCSMLARVSSSTKDMLGTPGKLLSNGMVGAGRSTSDVESIESDHLLHA